MKSKHCSGPLSRRGIVFGSLIAVACWTGLSPSQVRAQSSDYDRRAARALFNAVKPGSVPVANNLPADLPNKLNTYEVQGAKRTYAALFGARSEGQDDRGYYKIVLNGELSDAADAGWKTLVAKEPKTGAEIFWKRVEKSAADRFLSLGIRRKIGNVVLTVAQRRPYNEDPKAAGDDVLRRFAVLLQQAKENKLLARLAVMQIDDSGATRELDLAQPLRFSVRAGEPTYVKLRAALLDSDNQPITGVELYRFQLRGPLTDYVTLEGAKLDSASHLWTVEHTDVGDVRLRLDPQEGRLSQRLYAPFTDAQAQGADQSRQAAIRLRVGVKMAQTK